MGKYSLAFAVAWSFGVLSACSGSVENVASGAGGIAPASGGNVTNGGSSSTGGKTACPAGAETCACNGNDTCDSGLTCASHLCVRLNGVGGANAGGASSGGYTVVAVGGGVGGHATGGLPGVGGKATGGAAVGSGGQNVCAGAPATPNSNWVAPPGCGDGILNQASEQCDDGNTIPGDGCNGLCQVESNWACGTPCKPCTITFKCGDGVVNPGEACDQGQYQGSPGCSSDCKTQAPGYACLAGQKCVALYLCGNGRIETGESCDPPKPGNGCTATCQTETGWRCKPGSCYRSPYCGDGIVQANLGEVCDQGTHQGSPGCSADCRTQDGICACTPGAQCTCDITFCDAGTCTDAPRCGDGKVQLQYGEQCDRGAANSDTAYAGCTTHCTFGSYCGDGKVNGNADNPEACDDGNNDGLYGTCGVGCTLPPRCADGIVQSDWGEECEPSSFGDPSCTAGCRFSNYCGDAVVQANAEEQCDYGVALNTGEYGGCNSNCTSAPYCGDGIANGPEQCDMGTAWNNGDYGSCTATCRLGPHCGDGIVNGPEQCDDGTGPSGNGSVGSMCTTACVRYLVFP